MSTTAIYGTRPHPGRDGHLAAGRVQVLVSAGSLAAKPKQIEATLDPVTHGIPLEVLG
jgi:hypothetical protein